MGDSAAYPGCIRRVPCTLLNTLTLSLSKGEGSRLMLRQAQHEDRGCMTMIGDVRHETLPPMTNAGAASKLVPTISSSGTPSKWPEPKKTPSPELLAAAAQVDSSTLHEAAGRIGSLPSAIKAVAPGMTICGPAFPVKGPPLDNLAMHFAIDEAQPGDVIVADVGGHYEGGYFGR